MIFLSATINFYQSSKALPILEIGVLEARVLNAPISTLAWCEEMRKNLTLHLWLNIMHKHRGFCGPEELHHYFK